MKRRLLFVVTEDWYFVSHRLSLAVSAQRAGFEVTVATREAKHGAVIRNAGIGLIPFELSRRGGNPILEICRLIKLFRREKPDVVHLVAMKPVVYGGLSALIAGVPNVVCAVAGLGWLFGQNGVLQSWVQSIFGKFLAFILSSRKFITIVQNQDDLELLKNSGVPKSSLHIVRGAGVDVNTFAPPTLPPPPPVITVLVARMLWDKGVREFVEAARILHGRFPDARFVLVGDPDVANPTAIKLEQLIEWNGQDGVEWWGRKEEIAEILQHSHIACLPSYREGLPKSLLEAAAVGLPIVATDVPGCREVVVDGINGIKVPSRNSEMLAEGLAKLIEDPALRSQMGRKSRELALSDFSEDIVNREILAIYRGLLN